MLVPFAADPASMMMFSFRHAEQGLHGHQKGRQEHHSANRKSDIGISLCSFHDVGKTNLSRQGSEKPDRKANYGIIHHQ